MGGTLNREAEGRSPEDEWGVSLPAEGSLGAGRSLRGGGGLAGTQGNKWLLEFSSMFGHFFLALRRWGVNRRTSVPTVCDLDSP